MTVLNFISIFITYEQYPEDEDVHRSRNFGVFAIQPPDDAGSQIRIHYKQIYIRSIQTKLRLA